MPTIRRSRADIDAQALAVALNAQPAPSEAEIDAMAAEDGDAWTDQDVAEAELVLPPPSAEEIRALRSRLGLSQPQFARRFGFSLSALRQYEYGRRSPRGAATTLLRLVQADADGVARTLRALVG
jgi:putative transcriptional regulator